MMVLLVPLSGLQAVWEVANGLHAYLKVRLAIVGVWDCPLTFDCSEVVTQQVVEVVRRELKLAMEAADLVREVLSLCHQGSHRLLPTLHSRPCPVVAQAVEEVELSCVSHGHKSRNA